MTDLDTPYHDDHVRDDVLTAGCERCAPFFAHPDRWEEHRDALMPPLWGAGGPTKGQVITIAGTAIQSRWNGHSWELVESR